MTSLRAHLRRPGSHGGLPFHPDCPVCRDERLVGQLHPQAITSHRTLAALTAGLLAVSAAAPPLAAAAREPDQEQTGTADPGATTDSSRNPDHDPGGAGNTAPDTSTPSPAPGTPEPDPPDPEPAKDTPAPVDDQGDKPDPDTQRQTGPDTTQTPAPQTPAAPAAPTPTATATPTGVVAPAPVGQVPQTTLVPHRPKAPHQQPRHPKHMTQTTTPLGTSTPEIQMSLPAPQAQADTPVVEPSTPATRTAAPHVGGTRAVHGGRVHVVVAGESLWSIARGQLGHGASNADIAREVHRLWELNAKVIATGNPDLLPVGTKLKL